MSLRRVGVLTMFMLVALRMTIGWHFFKEGWSHYEDPAWSSAGFLKQAKGPLASWYQSYLTDDYTWLNRSDDAAAGNAGEAPLVPDKDLQGEGDAKGRPAWKKWADDVAARWEAHRVLFVQSNLAGADEAKNSEAVLKDYRTRLESYLESHADDIDKHLRERARLADMVSQQSASNVPYQKKRVADKTSELASERTAWQQDINSLQAQYHAALASLKEGDAQLVNIQYDAPTSLQRVDKIVVYGLIGVGLCLLAGLFSRTAAVLGAIFLASIISTQPPWVADAVPTYDQFVEMVALLALATTAVGRWAGLDFFIHHLIFWPFRPSKVSKS